MSIVRFVMSVQYCFPDRGVMEFDKMQIIFKAITEVPVTPSGGKELYCTLWRRCLMLALESISVSEKVLTTVC